jgi:hypothetical protein
MENASESSQCTELRGHGAECGRKLCELCMSFRSEKEERGARRNMTLSQCLSGLKNRKHQFTACAQIGTARTLKDGANLSTLKTLFPLFMDACQG